MSTIAEQDVLATINSSNRFLIQQLFKPIGNEYRISVPAPGSTDEGAPVLFVKQKKLKIKEDIRFRAAPDDDAHVFMIKSKSVFEFRGRHEVLDAKPGDGFARPGDGLGDEGRVAQGRQTDPEDAVPELRHQLGRRLDRESCLPRAARAGQGDQSGAVVQELDHLCHLQLAAHER